MRVEWSKNPLDNHRVSIGFRIFKRCRILQTILLSAEMASCSSWDIIDSKKTKTFSQRIFVSLYFTPREDEIDDHLLSTSRSRCKFLIFVFLLKLSRTHQLQGRRDLTGMPTNVHEPQASFRLLQISNEKNPRPRPAKLSSEMLDVEERPKLLHSEL